MNPHNESTNGNPLAETEDESGATKPDKPKTLEELELAVDEAQLAVNGTTRTLTMAHGALGIAFAALALTSNTARASDSMSLDVVLAPFVAIGIFVLTFGFLVATRRGLRKREKSLTQAKKECESRKGELKAEALDKRLAKEQEDRDATLELQRDNNELLKQLLEQTNEPQALASPPQLPELAAPLEERDGSLLKDLLWAWKRQRDRRSK